MLSTSGTITYVCNGTNGTDGLSVVMATEVAGLNCPMAARACAWEMDRPHMSAMVRMEQWVHQVRVSPSQQNRLA